MKENVTGPKIHLYRRDTRVLFVVVMSGDTTVPRVIIARWMLGENQLNKATALTNILRSHDHHCH